MATKVHMEALSPTMEEGQLVRWLKNEGDQIKEGDVLAEIETDKATMELVARGSGVLRSRTLNEGQTAAVGTVIAVIAGADEDVSAIAGGTKAAAPAAKKGEPAAKEQPAAKEEPAAKKEEPAAKEKPAAKKDEPAKEPEAEGVPKEEPEGSKEVVAAEQPQAATEEKPVASANASAPETEKPNLERRSTPRDEDSDAEYQAKRKQDAAAPAAEREPRAAGERVKASPIARRMAAESGMELSGVSGSGPGGRIVKRDVEAGAANGAATAAPPKARATEGADVEDLPVSQMRKAIAKRLVTSIGPIPTFYLTADLDVSQLVESRERVNLRLADSGVKASINDFVIKAVAAALTRHPEINASWGETVIHRHRRIHIGVAVAVEDGLITPIVRDADIKGVAEISTEVRELAKRAREKKLKPEEYTGATFSISNLGMFGIDEFTAIINPPEAAILAVGAVTNTVVAERGEAVVRPRMRVTMSCDHRVIDGATGAKFLQTLRGFVEEPLMFVM